jgi:hypothetical protein
MLRPATPLSVLLFAAFVLLLLSVLSTPIISAIPLGSWEGIDFGVFGFCTPNGCTPIEIGYDVRECRPHPMLAFDNTRLICVYRTFTCQRLFPQRRNAFHSF